ncbi:MAG: hypothetical protein Q7R50_03965 [Dehalococcoidales bacterium]|nr:hypothetical protein [Dehalococcoidales bacterium]
MKRKILNISNILALVLSFVVAAVPVGSVLAIEAPRVATSSPPKGAVSVPGSVWAWGSKGATGLGDGTVGDKKIPFW